MCKRFIVMGYIFLIGFLGWTLFSWSGGVVLSNELPSKMQIVVDTSALDKENLTEFFSSGLDIVTVKPDGLVHIIATTDEYDRLISEGYDVTVVVPDLYARLVSLYGRSTGLGTLDNYHSYEETVQELLAIQGDHPDITQLQVIGTSIEGRDIYAMKVSDNAGIDEEEAEVLFTGLHHAREPISVEICLDLLNYLTDNYGSVPEVTSLVEERETWVVPIVNPDGYEYAQNVDAYWRKNRRNNGDGTFGVDNNRNYSFRWGWDEIGSSSIPESPTYRGTAPFSEPETQAVRDLTEAHDFVITVSHHSFGNLILYPWGYVYGPTHDEDAFEGIGGALSALNGYSAGRTPIILYKVNGEFSDWEFGDTSRKSSNLGFTIETGPDFYPQGYLIPQLIQEGREHNLYLLSIADAPYGFAPPPPLRIEPMPVDDDGSFMLTWRSPNQGRRDRSVRYELQELMDEEVITDDLEGGAAYWRLDGFSLSGNRYHSGIRSLYSGTGDLRTATATMRTDYKVRLRDALTFWTWYDIEDGYDYAYVEASRDGGLTFETLAGDITTDSNPNGNNEGNGINGSSIDWVPATFDLSDYAGEHLTLRFRYTTDPATLGSGFYIDDVSLVSTYGSVVSLSDQILDSSFVVAGRPEGRYHYRVRGIDGDGQWSDWSPIEAVWVVSSPYLAVSLIPDDNEVIPGGSLGFTVEIANISTGPESFEAWLDVVMPNGEPLPTNPFMGPLLLNLPPGGSVVRHLNAQVPGNAPVGGPWTLYLRTGNHPSGVVSEDGFQFYIIPPR